MLYFYSFISPLVCLFIIFSLRCFLLGGELSISKAVKTCLSTSVDDRVHTKLCVASMFVPIPPAAGMAYRTLVCYVFVWACNWVGEWQILPT
jgi:hypothetical protein